MSRQFLVIFIQIAVVFLSACAQDNSETSYTKPEAPAADPLVRPTQQQEVVLARTLPFKSDTRISYCEILSTQPTSYSGYRDQKVYPLASLSKVVTTAWALKKLGPDFKFQTAWYFKPVGDGVVDAYLKTNYDPVFNIEKVLYSLSLLRQQGVTRIRNLVIDETTRVYLSVLAQPHLELEQVPISSSDSAGNLRLILNSKNWSKQTDTARDNLLAWAKENNRTVSIPETFSVDNVMVTPSSQINLAAYSKQISFNSASLFKYLKNLNVYSSNYMADALFQLFGSVAEFNKFQSSVLKLKDSDLQMFTGSGLSTTDRSGVRIDNQGTCVAMLNILKYIDKLAQQSGLDLGHVLYNPTQDQDGTFESNMPLSNQVLLKTGRLYDNPALNLAGMIGTEKGNVYFTFLGHQFLAEDAVEIENARDTLLQSALKYYPLKKSFSSLKEFQIFIN